MLCPHCHRTIAEQDKYLMSQRTPKDQPLPEPMRRLGIVGACLIALPILAFIFHLIAVG